MADTMKDILERTKALIQQKTASFNSNVAGQQKSAAGLDTAGAKDERTADTLTALEPASVTPEKKETVSADANAKPPSNESGTGKAKAEGKVDSTETGAQTVLTATEPALQPQKKELITGDANAKHAATIANDILGKIRAIKQGEPAAKQAEMPPQLAKAKEEKKETKVEEKKEPKAEEKKEDVKAKAAASTGGLTLQFDEEILKKIGEVMLSTEEGADMVQQQFAKAAGAEAANEILGYMAEQSEIAEKQAAYAAGQADAQALINQAIYEAGVKHGAATKNAAEEKALFAKLGQATADASIEDLMGAGAGAGGAPGADAGAGAVDAGAGAEAEISPEELAQALQTLVQQGTLSEEEASQVLDYVMAAEGGEGAAGAAGGAAAPAAAPAPAPAAEVKDEKKEEPKEAQVVTKAAALLDAIKQIKAAAAGTKK